MIEIIKGAFAAGEVKTFLIQGEYLEILEAAYPIDIAMLDRSGAQLSVMRNAEASYYSRPGRYEVVQVTSPLAQTVRIFVGSGDAGTRRTSGDVSVIDGGANRTMKGKTFSGALVSGALAANNAWVQVFNPANSGLNLIVEKISMGSNVAQKLRWGFSLGSIGGAGIGGLNSKKTGAVASVSQGYVNNLPDIPVGFGYLGQLTCQASDSLIYELREPIVISPGYGFAAGTAALNSEMNLTAEFFEEVI